MISISPDPKLSNVEKERRSENVGRLGEGPGRSQADGLGDKLDGEFLEVAIEESVNQ